MFSFNKNQWATFGITVVRVAVGWHFLYEGFSKLFIPGWTAQPFLAGSNSFIAGFYHWLADSSAIMSIVDILNISGLILIGLGLFLGVFIRAASMAGIFLLALYYFAYPPFGVSLMMQPEGALYIVNKNFIEAAILLVFVFIGNKGLGLDRLFTFLRSHNLSKPKADLAAVRKARREAVKNIATFPLLGVLGFGAIQSRKKYETDVISGATIQLKQVALSELKGELPMGKIGNHEISRLVAGGNLIGGWAHARDLIYASSLFKAYNTEKKVYETLMLAEQAGINAINIGYPTIPMLEKYKKMTGSKMKVITQLAANDKNESWSTQINKSIDAGMDIIQVQGGAFDALAREQKFDIVEEKLELIRSQGYVAGLGAHTVDGLIECEARGIIPDYYMKTMHHDNYWSAHPRENRVPYEVDHGNSPDHNRFHDNLFCLFPAKTNEFVRNAKVPVMGFKVLAAGAIQPEDGFRWAFENGADFICVGMFDFQVVHDVNVTIDVLNNLSNRKRDWFA
jgi:uncharacterized membrane protein YphA (DoxX/SURF4 family)